MCKAHPSSYELHPVKCGRKKRAKQIWIVETFLRLLMLLLKSFHSSYLTTFYFIPDLLFWIVFAYKCDATHEIFYILFIKSNTCGVRIETDGFSRNIHFMLNFIIYGILMWILVTVAFSIFNSNGNHFSFHHSHFVCNLFPQIYRCFTYLVKGYDILVSLLSHIAYSNDLQWFHLFRVARLMLLVELFQIKFGIGCRNVMIFYISFDFQVSSFVKI